MLFDDPYAFEVTDLTCGGGGVERIPARRACEGRMHVQSTAKTAARYAILKTKRPGSTWNEGQFGRYLYRMGPGGVTVFDTHQWR